MEILWLAVKTLGSLFVVACALRAYLQAVRLHAQNPLSRLTFQMTDWIVLPIRRLVPGFGGLDWASVLAALVMAIVLAVAFYFLMSANLLSDAVSTPKPVRPFGWIAALAVLWLVRWCLQLAVVILIVSVLMSWLSPLHPLKPVFDLLARPLLLPFWRLTGRGDGGHGSDLSGRGRQGFGRASSPRSGFDLSPIGAFLVLQILAAVAVELEAGVMRHLF